MLRAATAISLLYFIFSAPAFAHIVASPATAPVGSWFKTNLRISHGCEGSDTKKITVTVPKDILIIKPQVKSDWKITVQKRKLDKPVAGPHGPISEITESISWQGNLPDAYFDEFGLSMKLPEEGKVVYLPVLQECVKGSQNWEEIPMENMGHHHDGFPAPAIELTK